MIDSPLSLAGYERGGRRQIRSCVRRQEPTAAWAKARISYFVDYSPVLDGKRRRPEFDRMMAAIEAGSLDALAVREVRHLEDRRNKLESLLRFLEARHVPLISVLEHVDTRTQDVQAALAAFDRYRKRLTRGPFKSAKDRPGGR